METISTIKKGNERKGCRTIVCAYIKNPTNGPNTGSLAPGVRRRANKKIIKIKNWETLVFKCYAWVITSALIATFGITFLPGNNYHDSHHLQGVWNLPLKVHSYLIIVTLSSISKLRILCNLYLGFPVTMKSVKNKSCLKWKHTHTHTRTHL